MASQPYQQPTRKFTIIKHITVEAPKVGICIMCWEDVWDVNGELTITEEGDNHDVMKCSECGTLLCDGCAPHVVGCPNETCSLFIQKTPLPEVPKEIRKCVTQMPNHVECQKCAAVFYVDPLCGHGMCTNCRVMFTDVKGHLSKDVMKSFTSEASKDV